MPPLPPEPPLLVKVMAPPTFAAPAKLMLPPLPPAPPLSWLAPPWLPPEPPEPPTLVRVMFPADTTPPKAMLPPLPPEVPLPDPSVEPAAPEAFTVNEFRDAVSPMSPPKETLPPADATFRACAPLAVPSTVLEKVTLPPPLAKLMLFSDEFTLLANTTAPV